MYSDTNASILRSGTMLDSKSLTNTIFYKYHVDKKVNSISSLLDITCENVVPRYRQRHTLFSLSSSSIIEVSQMILLRYRSYSVKKGKRITNYEINEVLNNKDQENINHSIQIKYRIYWPQN